MTLSRLAPRLPALAMTVPPIVFAYMLVVFLSEGVDLPYFDDWDDYARAISGDLSAGHLFQGTRSTIYPVGKALDSLILPRLNGNTLAYQVLTLVTVLGGIMLLQWRLLIGMIGSRWLAASAFLLTIGMLQPISYWGAQYFAFHQALPLLAYLLLLYVLLVTQWPHAAKAIVYFVLGVISGFAYLSGGFAGLAGAVALIALGFARHREDFKLAGIAFGTASLVTAVVQWSFLGPGTDNQFGRYTYPTEIDFYTFGLGKISRSLGLPASSAGISFTIAAAMTAFTVALVLRTIRDAYSRPILSSRRDDRAAILIFLSTALAVYLGLISYGRANMFRPPASGFLDAFAFGYTRFHFLWLTVLWPWVFAEAFTFVRRTRWLALGPVSLAVASCIATAWLVSPAFDFRPAFREVNRFKVRGIACIQNQLMTATSINCPELYFFRPDLTHDYAIAVEKDVGFIASVPPSLRRFNPSTELDIYKYDGLQDGSIKITGASKVETDERTIEIESDGKALIEIVARPPGKLRDCQMIALSANIGGASDWSRMAYRFAGKSAELGQTANVLQNNETRLAAFSRNGFEDRVVFQPTRTAGKVTVSDIALRCWLPRQNR